jgi:general stress protein 26
MGVRHTEQDLAELQALLERSVDSAGRFMRETFELPDHGLTAPQLTGYFEERMRAVAIATVTVKGEPRVSPVGAVFHRTKFHIPTAEYSMRVRHLRGRPAISLTHFELNLIAVIVHGRAEIISPGAAEFEELDISEQEKWWHALRDKGQGVYLRIEPERMFAWAKDPGHFSGV